MDTEQIGPEWDRLRHAQLMAAASNGGNYVHEHNRPFRAADFLFDPWELVKVKPPTADETKAKLEAEIAALEDLFG